MAFACSSEAAAQLRSEQELIALLQSDAPEADKALACKELSIVGSAAAVPELAKLLSSERLASWARTPLEAMPGAEADEALRKASESLEGKLLVGVINSIGVRRDAAAVELLAGR
ncbi:MAG TPA: PBS lyase, partial [Pirellulaceae bacterium]|nr:PBS lyase [Pirellulaceae bacterium]